MRGEYGKSLLRRRGELIERSFAHCYETGGMRRCHLRGRENILKRQLVHVGAFNLSLILRKLLGAGTPRELKKSRRTNVFATFALFVVPDDGRFLHPATQSPDSPADGTIFPVPHTSSPLAHFP